MKKIKIRFVNGKLITIECKNRDEIIKKELQRQFKYPIKSIYLFNIKDSEYMLAFKPKDHINLEAEERLTIKEDTFHINNNQKFEDLLTAYEIKNKSSYKNEYLKLKYAFNNKSQNEMDIDSELTDIIFKNMGLYCKDILFSTEDTTEEKRDS
ncbi:hypothetical protein EDEG_02861 [Edhazardia aedis USNM 41457]|uniref:Uncharacterized protein n=1 Tax=Edhazardia aedis (strain USNM 41457) TaxID=1003232 RepID=J9DJE8_EDHAE|nr:hypothetical protein EDEG_02861 [Edhazardia aedis USNM 41457]|eukprot:EJW02740.1 hypothetical protein EDEG_02861 [Edhazardia aedis USNM 41457]